jgi:hypothetical protein
VAPQQVRGYPFGSASTASKRPKNSTKIVLFHQVNSCLGKYSNDFTSLKETLGATKTGHLYKDKNSESIYVVKYEQVRPREYGGESRRRLTNEEIALEKLAYDLYQLCGVFVPPNFLIKDKENLCIASEYLPGFKKLDELSNISLKDPSSSPHDLNQRRAESLSKQQFNGKPIRGFFENLAAFGFVFDYDGLGQSFDNFGFIEKSDHYQFVKIDPGQASLLARPNGTPIETNGFRALDQKESTILGEWDLGERCGWNYKKAFRSATYEQKLDGLGRITNLSDEIISQTVNNTAGKDYIAETKRQQIVMELIRRRNLFKEQYKNDLTKYKPKQIEQKEIRENKQETAVVSSDNNITTPKSPTLEIKNTGKVNKPISTPSSISLLLTDIFDFSVALLSVLKQITGNSNKLNKTSREEQEVETFKTPNSKSYSGIRFFFDNGCASNEAPHTLPSVTRKNYL